MEELTRQEQRVLTYIDDHRAEMLALWERLVATESPTEDKRGVDAVGRILGKELEAAGARVEYLPNEVRGDLLHGEWGTGNPGKPIIFCGHMDTVFPLGTLEKRPFRLEDGRAYGPGILDMKAGLTIAVYVLKALQDAQYHDRPIRILFASDEEGGHRKSDSISYLQQLSRGAGAAFNFETGYPDDGIVVSRKGCARFSLDVTGVEAHSGNCPEKGRSAVREMAHKILALEDLNDLPNGTSVNVGVISGGTVVNAVPGSCHADVDVRYTQLSRMEAVLAAARKIADTCYTDGCTCTMTEPIVSVAMEETPGNTALFRHVQETARRIGYGDVKPIRSGGWSDSNLLSAEGVPVVCAMGVRGEHNHTTREYAEVESLFARAKLAAAAVLGLE